MDYLKIHDWDDWQTYRSDRSQPPWIKVHRRMLRDPKWVGLSDAERGQLVAMWLLAADKNGAIPASSDLIQKLCYMSKPPDINKFIHLGFIENNGCQPDATLTPNGYQPDANMAPQTRLDKTRLDKRESIPLGEFKNITLSEVQLENLKKLFGTQVTQERIDRLSEYIASKGKKYKDHYATILSWARKDGLLDKKAENKRIMTCPKCNKPTHALIDGLCYKCKGM